MAGGVAYVPCMTNLRALCARVIRWHVTCMLSLAEHWQGRRALSNHVCAHSVISMWHVVCLQHLARACSEQSRLTTVLPINHVIQMPQCLSGFVNHDYRCVCMPDCLLNGVPGCGLAACLIALSRGAAEEATDVPFKKGCRFVCAVSRGQIRGLQAVSWRRHQMETFSASLALCVGNSPVPVNSTHKGQWRGALMFSLICVWINGWVNNRETGDLRRHRGHYDVIVMIAMKMSPRFTGMHNQ